MKQNIIFKTEHLTKRFTGMIANDDINLEIAEGEILAIIGENGAGKSTFCKMLTGLYIPDDGCMYMNGEKVDFQTPSDSMKAGISMVYQERNLVGLLNGAQNICLNREPKKNGLIDEKETMRMALEVRDRLGLTVPLDVPVEKLGDGEQQLIEIMRAFVTNPKLLILDEPTASLGEGEIEPFLRFIKEIRDTMNLAIIFISHKIDELYDVADRIAVFTDGKNVLTERKEDLPQEKCIAAMLRNNTVGKVDVNHRDFEALQPLLKVKSGEYDGKLHQLDFEVRAGEAVGVYGLVGAGRTECAEYLYGLRRATKREFEFDGETITKGSPMDMIKKGIVLVPEKRSNGVFRSLSIVDNVCNLFLNTELTSKVLGVVRKKKCEEFTLKILQDNNVKYTNMAQPISGLSGGNMQKVIIGRSVAVDGLKLLILDEPTTGMDVGAKQQIYVKIRKLVDENNLGVMFISSELEELMATCDRICVFAGGNCITSFDRQHFDKHQILETAIRGRRIDA